MWYNPLADSSGARDGNKNAYMETVPRAKIVAVIPPGIELTARRTPCHSLRIVDTSAPHASQNMRVGYVARLHPEKGPGIFLKVAKEIAVQMAENRLYGKSASNHIEFLVWNGQSACD